MRTLVLTACFVLSFATSSWTEPLKEGERQRLLAHLDMTEQWLASEVQGLSREQVTFRMAPDTWSIRDVLEHLAVAEPQYWEQLQKSMRQPATTEKIEATDADILWYGIDRTRRAKTGEPRTPTGRFTDAAQALAAFRSLRGTMRDYAAATTDDLRGRKLLEGNMDVYQWFLMISAHAQRHILQVREIKAHERFPRS